MKKMTKIVSLAMALTITASGTALATPSTQIWIPSTDIQGSSRPPWYRQLLPCFRCFQVMHPVPAQPGMPMSWTSDLTVGILPFEKIQMEIGFDYLAIANDPNDNHPFSGNFKLGTPEDSICKFSPALAVGMYNVGPSQPAANAPLVTSGQNIVYALAARTLPVVGRLSAGYYQGSKRALVDTRSMRATHKTVACSFPGTGP